MKHRNPEPGSGAQLRYRPGHSGHASSWCTPRPSRKCTAAARHHVTDVKRRLPLPKTWCRSPAPQPWLGACATARSFLQPNAGSAAGLGRHGWASCRRPMPSHCARCGRAGCTRIKTSLAWPRTKQRLQRCIRHVLRPVGRAGGAASFSTSRCTTRHSTTPLSQNLRNPSFAAARAVARHATGPNSVYGLHRRQATLLTPSTRYWWPPGTDGHAAAARPRRFLGPRHAAVD